MKAFLWALFGLIACTAAIVFISIFLIVVGSAIATQFGTIGLILVGLGSVAGAAHFLYREFGL